MRNLSINFNLEWLTPNGGARATFEMASRLSRRGHTVTITSSQVASTEWFSTMSKAVRVIGPPPSSSWSRASSRRPTGLSELNMELDLVKKFSSMMPQCDINVATTPSTIYAVFFGGKGIPIHYCHGYEVMWANDVYGRLFARSSYSLPVFRIAVSKWLAKLLKAVAGKDFPVIPNGVNRQVFKPSSQSKKSGVMTILRGRDFKGDRDVCQLIRSVRTQLHGEPVYVVGLRPRDQLAKDLKQYYGSVVPCGSPDDQGMVNLYNSARCFLSPSKYETFSLVPLEAMSCGTPVVGYSNLGIREWAFNNRNCLLVPAGDVASLEQALIRVLHDDSLSTRLRVEGLKTALLYDWERTVDKFVAVVDGLIV